MPAWKDDQEQNYIWTEKKQRNSNLKKEKEKMKWKHIDEMNGDEKRKKKRMNVGPTDNDIQIILEYQLCLRKTQMHENKINFDDPRCE